MATFEEALRKYPDWAWAFNIPEIGNLLRRGIDDPSFNPIPEILQTNYYKTTQASVRQWEALQKSDPASAEARRREELSRIWDMQVGMGLGADPAITHDLAERSLRLGWGENQLRDAIAMQLKYQPGSSAVGSVSSTAQQLKEMAGNYLVTLDDETAFNYAKSVLAGEHSAQDWVGVWADQAKRKFPTIASYIDKGITPAQYFAPAQQRIASILEINPKSVDFNDTKWNKVINTVDEKGVARPMTDNEIDIFARQQDGFKQTRQGQQLAADLGAQITSMFGKVAN